MYSIKNHDTRPQHNLALEEYLCRLAGREGSEFFMLWRNEPSVIIGRHQNTLNEIDAGFVRERRIHVVRRNSGGGAVYHDLGNVNYSFITADRGSFDFASFTGPILRALAALGVNAEPSGRNDIVLEGRKISGGAQYRRGGILTHHGTLLFDSDLGALSRALKPPKEKFTGRGVASVRGRVANIRPHLPRVGTAQDFIKLLESQIPGLIPRILTEKDAAAVQKLMDEKYLTWEWNYGASPAFSERRGARFPWGGVEALLQIEDGIIKNCLFYGDYFGSGDYSPLLERITNVPYTRKAVHDALAGLDTGEMFAGSSAADIEKLLAPDL